MEENKRLFWKGAISKIYIALGMFLVILALFFAGFEHFIIAGTLLVAGIFFGVKGKMQNFGYQRESGVIIHKGEW